MNINSFLALMVPLSLYYIITLIGALLTDNLNTIRGKDKTFRLSRILIGSTFGSFLMVALEKFLIDKISFEILVFIALCVGSVSFELFNRVINLECMIKWIKVFQETRKVIGATVEVIENEENKDKK